MTPSRKGYRGYICARMGGGRSVPQHIQQAVMRDYCARRGMEYMLAAVEYRMEGCTMILDAVTQELEVLEGIVMYSFFLLPEARQKRLELYRHMLEKGCTLHLAAEGIAVACEADAARLEDACLLQAVLPCQATDIFNYLTEWDYAGNQFSRSVSEKDAA